MKTSIQFEDIIKALVVEILQQYGVLAQAQSLKSITSSDYLNTKEVGKFLQQSDKYISKLIRQGKLAGIKIGKKWLVHQDDLSNYLTKTKK